MLFSKQDFEYLYNSLSKKFSLYDFIDDNYLNSLLNSLCNTGSFENLTITKEEISSDVNPLFYLGFKIQNYLYYKVCKLAEEDIDILLVLVEDKRRVVNLVFRKLKVEDTTKLEDYIMNVATLYNGEEAFDTFLTRYVMSSLKGVSFEMVRKTKEEKEPEKIVDTSKKKKKKKKDKKNKGSSLVAEKPKKEDDVVFVSVEESSLNKDFIRGTGVSCDSAGTEGIIEEVNEPDTMEATNDWDTGVVLVEDSCCKSEEVSDILEVVEEVGYFDKVVEKCNLIKGTAIRDNFIGMVLMCDLVDKISFVDDECYKIYFLMRYGLMNGSFYNREEVAMICEISLEEVISYERRTINYLRNYLNQVVNNYEIFLLCKNVQKA